MSETPPPTPPLISNPYKDLKPCELRRLSADVSRFDKHLIQSIHPERGILQLIVNNAIAAIANDIRAANITSYTPENATAVEEFVRRRAASAVAREGLEPVKP